MRFLPALLLVLFTLPAFALGDAWHIKKAAWSGADEFNYQAFIRDLGYVAFEKRCNTADGTCRTIADLLRSGGNPYRESNPAWIGNLNTDCADFPLTLRAYFAWKNSLPHAVASGVAPVGYCNAASDTRFCINGNKVVSRRTVRTGISARTVLQKWSVSPTTSIYRMHHADEHGLGSDFYTPVIDRNGITPGTILYDPNGHTSMVFDVLNDGRILFLETGISGDISTGYLGPTKLVVKSDATGWGFKKFKPVQLVGAQQDSNGNLVGGKVVVPRATQVSGYSPLQYSARLDPDKDKYQLDGEQVSYYEFVRRKLSRGAYRIDPVAEIRQLVEAACITVKERVEAVDYALSANMDEDPHPERLPPNIYGTGGRWQWYHWESFSTPSRDAHIKTSLKHILDMTRDIVRRHRDSDPLVTYTGDNIAADMLAAYTDAGKKCRITYTNSADEPVTLDFLQVTRRAFRLSFDPYHCAELRWGASGAELESCPTDSGKMRWYENQQFLRNQIERRYNDRMDFTVEELATLRPGNGVAQPPDIDVAGYLKSLD